MPKTIKERRAEIAQDGALQLKLQSEATKLMLKAIKEPEWKSFVANFIDNNNPEQLLRLTLQDEMASDPYILQSVTYLLSTPMCGMATPSAILDTSMDVLDVGISSKKLEEAAKEREILAEKEKPKK